MKATWNKDELNHLESILDKNIDSCREYYRKIKAEADQEVSEYNKKNFLYRFFVGSPDQAFCYTEKQWSKYYSQVHLEDNIRLANRISWCIANQASSITLTQEEINLVC